MSSPNESTFKLNASEDCRVKMSEELSSAPTYRIEMKPDKRAPKIISVKTAKDGEGLLTETELVTKSLGKKLVESRGSSPGPLETPQRYEKLGTLGEGGAGTVYEMADHNTHRRVAIKVLKSGSDSADVDAFINEGILASELEHPNIIPIYDLDADANGQVYLSMKKIEGQELLPYVQSKETRDHDDIALIFLKVCDALNYAHSVGKVHQDVKPDNIMVGRFGEVFLIDWGAGSLMGEDMQVSPVYMSPQQAAGDSPSPADDIYCLGASLFHVLTDRFPTTAETIDELWEKKLDGIIDPLDEPILRDISQPLLAIALKAMEPDLADRYASAEAVANDLKAYQSGYATSAENAGAWVLLTLLLKRRWKETIAVVAAIIFLSVGSVSYYLGIQEARLNAEQANLELKQEEVARLDAELKAEKMERDRQEQWFEVVDQNFARNQRVDPRFKTSGTPMIDDDGLLLGNGSTTGTLSWNEHIGLEQKIEVSFSCKSPAFLNIDMSMDDQRKGYGLEIADGSIMVEHGNGWNVLTGLQVQAQKAIRYDRPNTVVFWRERNRFFATINGVPALEHTVVSDISGSENGFFRISRSFSYDRLRIHSIRVWRRQEPLFVPALAQGRTLVRAGNVEQARNLFLHQSRNCPKESVRQEAQYLAARLAPDMPLKLAELEIIIQDENHVYRAEALHDSALLLATTDDWRRAVRLATDVARIAPQLTTVERILPSLREHLVELPLKERMAVLSQIPPLLQTTAVLRNLDLRDVTFLRKSDVRKIDIAGNPITDISPLKDMPVYWLSISSTKVTDLSALQTMPLKRIAMDSTPVNDLSPLKGKELWYLSLRNCPNLDTSTLAGVKVRLLSLDKSPITRPEVLKDADIAIFRARHCSLNDISFLKGMKPLTLALSHNEITDLSPLGNVQMDILDLDNNQIRTIDALRGSRIGRLNLNDNPLSDISALSNMDVRDLRLSRTRVTDISPLATMSIRHLKLDGTQVADFSPLLSIPTLESLSIKNVTLSQDDITTLSKLPLKRLTMNLDKMGLTMAARMKTLETFSGFGRKEVFSIAPTVLTVLNKGEVTPAELRTFKQLASQGVERNYLLLPIQLSYDEATTLCAGLGGTLACPANDVQSTHLVDYLEGRGKRFYKIWIGVEPVDRLFNFQSGADPAWYMNTFKDEDREKIRQGQRVVFSAQGGGNRVVGLSADGEVSGVVVEWQSE